MWDIRTECGLAKHRLVNGDLERYDRMFISGYIKVALFYIVQ